MPAVKLEYWHKDHLGSLVATTDHAGAVTARYSYDPFGKRRYSNATYDPMGDLVVDWTSNTNTGTDRGFTGHEHLDDVGIIHMNGRLYEPSISRFMQPDPMVQDPGNLQNYDRYGYCFNNPTTCTDPSGYSAWTRFRDAVIRGVAAWADGMGCAGACSAAVAYHQARRNGSVASAWRSAIAAYVGANVGDSGWANYVQIGSGAVQGCMNAREAGTSCVAGARNGAISAGIRSALGPGYGDAAAGCYGAERAERSCGSGARDGLIDAAGSWAGTRAAEYVYEQGSAYLQTVRQNNEDANRRECNGCPIDLLNPRVGSRAPGGRAGYISPEEAGSAAIQTYRALSVDLGREIGGLIYLAADGTYGFTDGVIGGINSVRVFDAINYSTGISSAMLRGDFHTHGDYTRLAFITGANGEPTLATVRGTFRSNPEADRPSGDDLRLTSVRQNLYGSQNRVTWISIIGYANGSIGRCTVAGCK